MADLYKTYDELNKGEWSVSESYTIGDFVSIGGSSYVCILNSLGNEPPNATYWSLIASKGDKGDAGDTGNAGPQGEQGEPGIQWRGDWNSITTYVERDVVYSGGSSYICISTNTNQEPPNATYWELIAQRGIDGEGAGDVVGPASAVTSRIAAFDGTTGKLLKDGGKTIAEVEAASIPIGYLDTDTALSANSDSKVPSQKAIKAYSDTKLPNTYLDTDVNLTANSDSKIATQKATKAYADTKVAIPASSTEGDILYRNSSAWTRLAKGTASQQLRMNSGATAPEWFTPTAAASFWTSFSGAYASGTTITVATDLTGLFKKGVVLKWQKSDNTFKTGMVISSSYSSPNTTITIVGSAVEANDKNFYYAGEMANKITFIIAGNQSTGTDVSKTWYPSTDVYPISVDATVKTAGTTNATTYDINDDSTTIITTKPSIASGATTDLNNVVDTPTTVIAAASAVTVDIDAASTTQAIDGYIDLFYFPTFWVSLT